MIDFYAWKTPNNEKISIMLEEVELPYALFAVNISKQEQFKPAFLAINPNNKVPAIVDSDGPDGEPITIFESGAILIYLAEKTGQLLPENTRSRIEVLQWLMFQMSGIGPMLGQVHHFLHYAPQKIPYAIERYTNEAKRLYRVMDEHLSRQAYFGPDYSIADIAIFPWVKVHHMENISLHDYPNVLRWYKEIADRPAVNKGIHALNAL